MIKPDTNAKQLMMRAMTMMTMMMTVMIILEKCVNKRECKKIVFVGI